MKKRLLVEKAVCTGCRYCEAVCSLGHSHEQEVNPRKARIAVRQDIPNALFAPVVCKQCAKAPCINACPFDALRTEPPLGIPSVDTQKCTGCAACVEACPFGAMFFDTERTIALKCDLCGGDPQCVKFCRALPQVGRVALSYATVEEWVRRKADIEASKRG